MKILIVDTTFEKMNKVVELPAVPRVGDRIDMFHRPCPTVIEVIWTPQESSLADFKTSTADKIDDMPIDVVVFVE